jgi:hypothetical protein
MQLNELLEEQSVKSISKKTMISEDDISNLVLKNFDNLNRTKMFGFISILEREYDVDLVDIKSDAEEFYAEHNKDSSYVSNLSRQEEKQKSGGFGILWLLVWLLVGAGYYVTQVDKKYLHKYFPFIEDFLTQEETLKQDVVSVSKEVVKKEMPTKQQVVVDQAAVIKNTKGTTTVDSEKNGNTLYGVKVITQKETKIKEVLVVNESITIIPKKRLWFGLVDVETKKRDHFSVSKPYTIEFKGRSWLIATSTAPFILRDVKGEQTYSNAKSNYFKVDKTGIKKLSKNEYVTQGGYSQW